MTSGSRERTGTRLLVSDAVKRRVQGEVRLGTGCELEEPGKKGRIHVHAVEDLLG